MVVQYAIGEMPKLEEKRPQKNQAAVTLGRLGGLKGGRARADKLTPEQRKTTAEKATPAMAAGLTKAPMQILDVVRLMEER